MADDDIYDAYSKGTNNRAQLLNRKARIGQQLSYLNMKIENGET